MPQKLLDNCKNCGIKLDESNFVYSKFSRLNSCRSCYNKYKRRVNKANYQEHVSQNKDYHKFYHIEKRYGLTENQYRTKLNLQLNGCAICKLPFGEDRKIGIDHDHKTNEVRDLLCYRCNNILGLLNDDVDLIWSILEYLKRHERRTA